MKKVYLVLNCYKDYGEKTDITITAFKSKKKAEEEIKKLIEENIENYLKNGCCEKTSRGKIVGKNDYVFIVSDTYLNITNPWGLDIEIYIEEEKLW